MLFQTNNISTSDFWIRKITPYFYSEVYFEVKPEVSQTINVNNITSKQFLTSKIPNEDMLLELKRIGNLIVNK